MKWAIVKGTAYDHGFDGGIDCSSTASATFFFLER
jgi:hypothetical protein